MIDLQGYITTNQAAEILKISRRRVNELCINGRFNGATQIIRDWLIPREAVANYTRRKPGPKKKIKVSNRDFLANVLKEVNKNGE